jgi:UPF0755 protein
MTTSGARRSVRLVAGQSALEGLDSVLRVFTQSLKVVTIAALSVVVLATGVWAFSYAAELARPSDAGEPVMLTIFEDQSDAEIADELAAQGLIRSTMLFQGQFKLSGGALIPGTYTLRKGMSVPQIVDRITGAAPAEEAPVQAESTAPESFDITIPEGWRIEQIAQEYERLGGKGGAQAFLDAVKGIDRSQFDFLAGLPADATLEGYLFPDTYRFDGNDPVLNVVTMLTNFGNKYTPDMRQRTQQMGLTIHDVVTLASVEREAQIPEERPTIADVYLSRWEQGWRLDADPTVQYVLGTPDEWWPKLSGDDLFYDSPYNTYQKDGLPPGPIANPGFASIQAVLFPNDTPYMYFVAKGESGEHAFAVTAEEQAQNVDQYLNSGG